MAEFVYVLSSATSLVCALLLWRGYRRNRGKLLFWGTCCFAGLTAENVFLYLDRITFPHVDLSVYRLLVGLVSLLLLIYGLVWEAD